MPSTVPSHYFLPTTKSQKNSGQPSKLRSAIGAYRHLLVQVSEGDRPPKDTSEEEIEEWNASAVIIPSVDPGYGTYVRMWKPIPAPWPRSPGSPVAWWLSRESDSPEF